MCNVILDYRIRLTAIWTNPYEPDRSRERCNFFARKNQLLGKPLYFSNVVLPPLSGQNQWLSVLWPNSKFAQLNGNNQWL